MKNSIIRTWGYGRLVSWNAGREVGISFAETPPLPRQGRAVQGPAPTS